MISVIADSQVIMCRLRTWDEEDEDHSLNTGNQLEHDEMRVEVRVAMLRAQIAGIEARVERLEARMLYLQRGLRIISALFFATLVYALLK